MAGRQRVQGRRRRPPVQGPAGPGQAARRSPYVEGAGKLVAPEHRRGRRQALHRPQRHPGHRLVLAARCPAWRSTASGSSPASTRSSLDRVPGVRDRARRRRDRRRVRQRVEVVRRRRDHRRGAAPAGRRRGRGHLQGSSSGRSASAKIDFKVGKPFEKVEQHRERRQGDHRRAARRSRPSCCWSPSAAARPPRTWGTRSRASRMDRGFVLTDERLRTNVAATSTRSATSCPACSSRTAASSRASSSPRRSPG